MYTMYSKRYGITIEKKMNRFFFSSIQEALFLHSLQEALASSVFYPTCDLVPFYFKNM